MRLVTGAAVGERRLVEAAMEWRQRIGARVASTVGARLERRARRLLCVRVVTIAAPPFVGIVGRHERREQLLHFVAAEAVVRRGDQYRLRLLDLPGL